MDALDAIVVSLKVFSIKIRVLWMPSIIPWVKTPNNADKEDKQMRGFSELGSSIARAIQADMLVNGVEGRSLIKLGDKIV